MQKDPAVCMKPANSCWEHKRKGSLAMLLPTLLLYSHSSGPRGKALREGGCVPRDGGCIPKPSEMEDVSQEMEDGAVCAVPWPCWPSLLPASSSSDLHRQVSEALLPLIHQHWLLCPCVPDQDLHGQRHKISGTDPQLILPAPGSLPHPARISSALSFHHCPIKIF